MMGHCVVVSKWDIGGGNEQGNWGDGEYLGKYWVGLNIERMEKTWSSKTDLLKTVRVEKTFVLLSTFIQEYDSYLICKTVNKYEQLCSIVR